MLISSLSGEILIQTRHKTLKSTLECCAAQSTALAKADLRRAKLTYARLDSFYAPGASLWGADLSGSDISGACLRGADLRNAMLKDACLAETDLAGADLRGAWFGNTILDGASLDGALVSCPSFWRCDLDRAASMRGLTYLCRGEGRIIVNEAPAIITGFGHSLILGKDFCLWRDCAYSFGHMPEEAAAYLFKIKTLAEQNLSAAARNAKSPMPKIECRGASF